MCLALRCDGLCLDEGTQVVYRFIGTGNQGVSLCLFQPALGN
jgi:hypothetical protein